MDRVIIDSILQNHKRSLKTRHRAVNSQKQNPYFDYGLVWIMDLIWFKYGFQKSDFFIISKYGFNTG